MVSQSFFLPATGMSYGQKVVNSLVTLQVYECFADVHNNWQSNYLIQITLIVLQRRFLPFGLPRE